MTIAYLKKIPNGFTVDEVTTEDGAFDRIKLGQVIEVEFKGKRNYEFHKKFFALLNIAFDAFQIAGMKYKGETVEKNFSRFRKDITILCGHYIPTTNINGDVRLEAKSISFGGMDEDEFNILYNKAVNVILDRVLRNYTREDLDEVVEQILRF